MRTAAAFIFLATSLIAQDVREQYYAAFQAATTAVATDPAASLEFCRRGIAIAPASERYFWPIMIEANAKLGRWSEVQRLGAKAVGEIEAGRLLIRLDQITDEQRLRKTYADALKRSGQDVAARRQIAIANDDPTEVWTIGTVRAHRMARARQDLFDTEFSQPVPPVRFRDLDGREVTFRGKIVIAAFWAEWCAPCLDELRALNEIYPRVRDRAEIVAINIDDSTAKIKAFVKKNGLALPMLMADDRDHDAAVKLQGETIPRLLAIDGTGIIRFQFQGTQEILPEKIEWIITRLAHAPN